MRTLRNMAIAVVSVAMIGFGVNALAHGRHGGTTGWGGDCGNYGPGMGGRGGYGQGYGDQLEKEEYKQLEQKREAFFKETREIRAGLFQKERELQNELAKTQPNTAKVSNLQKEVSDLQSRLDQKRVDHMAEMRKFNSRAGSGVRKHGVQTRGHGGRRNHGVRGDCYDW